DRALVRSRIFKPFRLRNVPALAPNVLCWPTNAPHRVFGTSARLWSQVACLRNAASLVSDVTERSRHCNEVRKSHNTGDSSRPHYLSNVSILCEDQIERDKVSTEQHLTIFRPSVAPR